MQELVKSAKGWLLEGVVERAQNASSAREMKGIVDDVKELGLSGMDDGRIDLRLSNGGEAVLVEAFHQEKSAEHVFCVLLREYIEKHSENILEDEYLDGLFDAASMYEVADELFAEILLHKDQLQEDMTKAIKADVNNLGRVPYFMDVFSNYLSMDKAKNRAGINEMFGLYQAVSEPYFSVYDEFDDFNVLEPYNSFSRVLEDDVKRGVSAQILRAAEMSAHIVATHLYQRHQDDPLYEAFFRANPVMNSGRFTSFEAVNAMDTVGVGDRGISTVNRALEMVGHVVPEHKVAVMKSFGFALEYYNAEFGREGEDLPGYEKWEAIVGAALRDGIEVTTATVDDKHYLGADLGRISYDG